MASSPGASPSTIPSSWDVPGDESPDALFAGLNPVTCEDGSYRMVPVEQSAGRDSACRDAAGT